MFKSITPKYVCTNRQIYILISSVVYAQIAHQTIKYIFLVFVEMETISIRYEYAWKSAFYIFGFIVFNLYNNGKSRLSYFTFTVVYTLAIFVCLLARTTHIYTHTDFTMYIQHR